GSPAEVDIGLEPNFAAMAASCAQFMGASITPSRETKLPTINFLTTNPPAAWTMLPGRSRGAPGYALREVFFGTVAGLPKPWVLRYAFAEHRPERNRDEDDP